MNLNENQKAAIECLDHNLQIVACAGSGKTEVITRRIVKILESKDDVLPKNIVAFTFTEKAAENMKARVQRIIDETAVAIDISNMYVGTIHSFCRQILNNYIQDYKDFRILDTVKEHLFIMKYYKTCGAEELGLTKREAALFSNCIDKMIGAYDVMDQWPEMARSAFEKYRSLLYEKRFINFSFLIYEVLRHANEPAITDFFKSIKYLIVDEYQDVDDLQEMLIHEISRHGANICVVGDDDQTIYQFRGSNADNMIGFTHRYDDVVTINLDTNYRSGKAILDVADCVISNNAKRLSKKMNPGNLSFDGSVKGTCSDGIENEYSKLVDDIKENAVSSGYGNIAILIRKRSRLTDLTRALELSGIPYKADDSDDFFESNYFGYFCNVFRYLEKPSDEKRQIIIDEWKDLTSPKNLKNSIRYLTRCSEKNERFVTILEQFYYCLGFNENHLVYKYAMGFSEILSDFDQVYVDDSWTVRISDVVIFLEKMAETEYQRSTLVEKEDIDAVQIMTVHQSKGLEFETVCIPDLQQGFFPAGKIGGKKYYSVLGGIFEEQKDKYESDIEDERKLFYVALTRAQKNLYVYADVEKKEASIFLSEMNDSKYCDIFIPPQKTKMKSPAYYYGDAYRQDEWDGGMNKELWQIYDLKAIKRDLLDELHGAYFGGGFGAAMVEFEDAKKATDEELLKIAQRNGIRIENYRK